MLNNNKIEKRSKKQRTEEWYGTLGRISVPSSRQASLLNLSDTVTRYTVEPHEEMTRPNASTKSTPASHGSAEAYLQATAHAGCISASACHGRKRS
ncbi:uncharacterized protein K452DRAFT_287261 [Aplosporella prunicola CBS 121167]|uniref:Uncharacterized protein n=1 Tax=Aplosporella prunicola CBS 121167 TaxID=1176127 RepID=A0A6A6BD33_9PEZI|nr:uncharacterized protein K452DRAFT_287261 [Aplosporella prunicola CBS 121167]KAF2142060.1 hypothetical protein K452DRAFT_287261 [Aplosporella prunicola CBS 121167]